MGKAQSAYHSCWPMVACCQPVYNKEMGLPIEKDSEEIKTSVLKY